MAEITRALLRKRAEHNEGMIGTLEEVSLHQEEIVGINEVLGMTCRKIKILYLQNNIIPKMENLFHLKDLVYLNLALNNIEKIEGLQNCEFLSKLDLTVNFIDLDVLQESIEHLQSRENLKELYMMGNPAEHKWSNFVQYVVAKLPQLQTLDGTEITRSMQLRARQQLPKLEVELAQLARRCRAEKDEKKEKQKQEQAEAAAHASASVSAGTAAKVSSSPSSSAAAAAGESKEGEVVVEDVEPGEEDEDGIIEIPRPDLDNAEEDDPNELTENTPEVRVKIYQELAQQKKQEEERKQANLPKKRDYEVEQQEMIKKVREKEETENW